MKPASLKISLKNTCLLFVSFWLVACSKSQSEEDLVCTTDNTLPVAQTVKDYFVFREGSWWVYKEENSNRTDSIWISSLSESTINYPGKSKRACKCGWGKCVQNLWVEFLHKRSDNPAKEFFRRYHITSSLETADKAYISRNTEHSYWDWLDYEVGEMKGNDPNFVSKFTTFSVSDTTYKDILYTYWQNGNYGPRAREWHAKNIHLVKFVAEDSTNWNLVKFNIVQ